MSTTRIRRLRRRGGSVLLAIGGVVALLWCVGALWYAPWPPLVAAVCVAALLGSVLVVALWGGPRERWGVAIGVLVILVAWHLLVRPSGARAWSSDQAVMPAVRRMGDQVVVSGVRDCRYRSVDDYDVVLTERTYDLTTVTSAWFVVEPFSAGSLAAHTFLSFGFADGRFLAISVEIRREQGEHYSPLAGMFRRYELMYVIADERDLIGLRAVHRRDPVHLYPVRAEPHQIRDLLADLLNRAERLRSEPEFYNTLTNTCTTNLVDHVDRQWPGRVPLSLWVWLPGRSDRLAYDLGLIATDQPFDQVRERHRIDDRVRQVIDAADFSAAIRK